MQRSRSKSGSASTSRGRRKTKSLKQKHELSTGSSASTSPAARGRALDRPTRRTTTVYDAVAGRITTHGFKSATSNLTPAFYRDTISHSLKPLSPGDALFLPESAPQRFREFDPYPMHRHLVGSEAEAAGLRQWIDDVSARENDEGELESDEVIEAMKSAVRVGRLPDGDLLRAVHGFSSRYYGVHGGKRDWRSLDETALLAIGILLEETVGVALGENGYRAFLESEGVLEEKPEVSEVERDSGPRQAREKSKRQTEEMDGEASTESEEGEEDEGSVESPPRKKQKTKDHEENHGRSNEHLKSVIEDWGDDF